MKYINEKQTGYTLIELLLYISITATLLLSVSAFYAMTLSSRIKNQSIVEVDQQATFAMDTISQTIRNASNINTPAPGVLADTLSVTVNNSNLNPAVFDLSSGEVRIKEGTSPEIVIAGGKVEITELTFINLSRPNTSGSLQIKMTVSRINNSGRNEYNYSKTYQTTVSLRP